MARFIRYMAFHAKAPTLGFLEKEEIVSQPMMCFSLNKANLLQTAVLQC